MKDTLKTGHADRQKTAAEAKKAMLEKFKPKPTVQPEVFVDSATKKAEERQVVRRARAEDKEEQRLAQVEVERLSEEARKAQRKERKVLTKNEQKAKREARLAARQAGK